MTRFEPSWIKWSILTKSKESHHKMSNKRLIIVTHERTTSATIERQIVSSPLIRSGLFVYTMKSMMKMKKNSLWRAIIFYHHCYEEEEAKLTRILNLIMIQLIHAQYSRQEVEDLIMNCLIAMMNVNQPFRRRRELVLLQDLT